MARAFEATRAWKLLVEKTADGVEEFELGRPIAHGPATYHEGGNEPQEGSVSLRNV
jgi:hypothetical protein